MIINVKKYIGREYDKVNFNCYTLVQEIQKDLGRVLPDIDLLRAESYKGRGVILSGESKKSIYEKIDLPIAGCIVTMQYASISTHCGVYIGGGQICHCVEDRGCVVSDINDLKITGFYNVKSN